jgi:hypothetical protein
MTKIKKFFRLTELIDFLLRIFRFFVRFNRARRVDSLETEVIVKNEPRSLCFKYFVAV